MIRLKRFSVIFIACLLFKNFRHTCILMDLLIFGKHLFIYQTRERRGLEVLSVASFIKANLNPTPSASSAGTSGLRVRNHQICRVFCEKHRRPGVPAFVVRIFAYQKTWHERSVQTVEVLSEDDSQDSPVPRSQENKAKSPKSPCWLRGLRTSVLWHDVVEICLTLDYHCWIFGFFSFFIYHWYLMSS